MKRSYAIFLFFFLFAAVAIESADYTEQRYEIKNLARREIKTPSLQKRESRKLRLVNGLEIYLVSDPALDKSGAALSVEAGSWNDPIDAPGMAHFLEHMLFLGTKKYPKESEFQRFVSERGGDSNAYTASDHTNYIFQVEHESFSAALDRFAQFFISPLFNPSGIDREVQAVDQEYAKSIESDSRRIFSVFKELANPDHPHSRFTIGNAKTLKNISQERLKAWYEENYSANLMHLVVYSKQNLDELEKFIVPLFNQVEDRSLNRLEISERVYNDNYKAKMLYIRPIKELRSLRFQWELPAKFAEVANESSLQALATVLGHEGKGSLLAKLKEEGLAESLLAYNENLGSKNAFFALSISLSKKGLDSIDQVISYFYEMLARLKKEGLPYYIYEENKAMAEHYFDWQSREAVFSAVSKDARRLTREDLASYPEKGDIPEKFDTKLVAELINFLSPRDCIMSVLSQDENIEFDKKEKWYGAEYFVRDTPLELLQDWENKEVNPDLTLNEKNPFVPEDLSLLKAEDPFVRPMKEPKLIADTAQAKVYYQKDDEFSVPELSWIFHVKTPAIHPLDPKSLVLAELYVRSVYEELNSFAYLTSQAGISYSLQAEDNGIVFKIEGFDPKAEILLEKLLLALKNTRVSEENFKIYKQSLLESYHNFEKEQPITQAFETVSKLLHRYFTTQSQKAAALQRVDFDELLQFSEKLFEKTYYEGMLIGNLEEDRAQRAYDLVYKELFKEAYPLAEHVRKEVLRLPPGLGPVFLSQESQRRGNVATLLLEEDSFSFEKRAAQQILSVAMESPFFSDLRTKQQTGYIVGSYASEIERQLFQFFYVHSDSHDPRDLLARFELFIESFLQELGKEEGFTMEKFSKIRLSQMNKLLLPKKNLREMASFLDLIAFDYAADFSWLEKRAEAFENLSFLDFIHYAHTFLGRDNHKRVGVFVFGQAEENDDFIYHKIQSDSHLRRLSTYGHKESVLVKQEEEDFSDDLLSMP